MSPFSSTTTFSRQKKAVKQAKKITWQQWKREYFCKYFFSLPCKDLSKRQQIFGHPRCMWTRCPWYSVRSIKIHHRKVYTKSSIKHRRQIELSPMKNSCIYLHLRGSCRSCQNKYKDVRAKISNSILNMYYRIMALLPGNGWPNTICGMQESQTKAENLARAAKIMRQQEEKEGNSNTQTRLSPRWSLT